MSAAAQHGDPPHAVGAVGRERAEERDEVVAGGQVRRRHGEHRRTGIQQWVSQSGIRWGVQRNIPLEVIKFGDPDGQGDLKRNNQIALRLEVVYGWYVFADRFTVIEDAVTP